MKLAHTILIRHCLPDLEVGRVSTCLPGVGICLVLCLAVCSAGCTLVPETRVRDSLHNPFPQIKRVAVLPFFNQSDQPNVDGNEVAQAYYAALQAIPGFEVLPVGVTAVQWRAYASQFGEPRSGPEFQRLAQMMDVEAIVVGSVTDFEAYYPPRMALTVHWYTANEGFHAIPPGYGLPWGTDDEKKIPSRIVRDAEFELARSQLKTQSPQPPTLQPVPGMPAAGQDNAATTDMAQSPRGDAQSTNAPSDNPLRSPWPEPKAVQPAQFMESVNEHHIPTPLFGADGLIGADGAMVQDSVEPGSLEMIGPVVGDTADGMVGHFNENNGSWQLSDNLPATWPNPTDLIPDPPSPVPPAMIAQHDPVLSHTRLFRADDSYFTGRLSDYVETNDDARGSSWQGYIKRTDDFIGFCCHLHITEMLEARGGRDPSDLILRWPVSRY